MVDELCAWCCHAKHKINFLNLHINKLQDAYQLLVNNNVDLEQTNRSLKKENEKLKSDFQWYRCIIESMEAPSFSLNHKELTEENEFLKKQRDLLCEKLKKIDENFVALEKAHEDLNDKYRDLDIAHWQLKRDFIQVKNRVSIAPIIEENNKNLWNSVYALQNEICSGHTILLDSFYKMTMQIEKILGKAPLSYEYHKY